MKVLVKSGLENQKNFREGYDRYKKQNHFVMNTYAKTNAAKTMK